MPSFPYWLCQSLWFFSWCINRINLIIIKLVRFYLEFWFFKKFVVFGFYQFLSDLCLLIYLSKSLNIMHDFHLSVCGFIVL